MADKIDGARVDRPYYCTVPSIRREGESGSDTGLNSDSVQLTGLAAQQSQPDDLSMPRIQEKESPPGDRSSKASSTLPDEASPIKSSLPGNITAIFMNEPPLHGRSGKSRIIDSLIEEGTSEKTREKIHRRLDKFPEDALKLISNNEVKILQRPLKFFGSDTGGGYQPDEKAIKIGNGSYTDFFIEHPFLSSLFAGTCSKAVKTGVQFAFVASVVALIGLPLAAALPVIGGLALTPLPLVALSKLRNRSVKNVLEHETAHALDVSLGRSPRYRDLPMCTQVESDSSIKHYNYAPGYTPFSLKCPELIAGYLACRKEEPGSSFVIPYASLGPEEYFAESVRVYLNTERKGSDAGRDDLRKKDRAMYMFIENLFRDISQGEFEKGAIP